MPAMIEAEPLQRGRRMNAAESSILPLEFNGLDLLQRGRRMNAAERGWIAEVLVYDFAALQRGRRMNAAESALTVGDVARPGGFNGAAA